MHGQATPPSTTSPVRDDQRPLLFEFTGITRYVPLIFAGGLFVGTALLSAFGPIDWQIRSPVRTYSFLAACALALAAGYALAVRRRPASTSRLLKERSRLGRLRDSSFLVVLGSALFLVLYLPVVHTTTGLWYPDVWGGLRDAGEAYARNKESNESGQQIALYARMLVAPVTVLLLPLTLFFWPRLSPLARWLGVTCVGLSLALTIAQGVNRGVAELCGYTVLFLVLVAASSTRKGRRRTLVRAIVGIMVVTALFAGYYGVTMNSRVASDQASEGAVDADDVDEAMSVTALQGVATEREGHVYFRVVPDAVEAEGVLFLSYLTHGYRGLSLAMDEDFTPTYGLGFSEFLRHNLLRATGQSDREEAIEERTYSGKLIAEGWPDGMVWSTFFIHPASDISFPGVVVLMTLIGFAFGLSWRDALTRYDPLACGVMFHLCILVFYLPANNQLFQGGELAIGFSVLLVAWLALRNRGRTAGWQPDEEKVAPMHAATPRLR